MQIKVLHSRDDLRKCMESLTSLLQEAIADGFSLGFWADPAELELFDFWTVEFATMRAGKNLILVAEEDEQVVGCVIVDFATKANAIHRAEIKKLLVARSKRRSGVGRALMQAAENAAMEHGRWLLVLDTEINSGADDFYRGLGFQELGTIPEYAGSPRGELIGSTFFWKILPH